MPKLGQAESLQATLRPQLDLFSTTKVVLDRLVAAVRAHRKAWVGVEQGIGEKEARETMWALGKGVRKELEGGGVKKEE